MMHFLSVFPSVLDLGWFFGVAFLRILVGATHILLSGSIIQKAAQKNDKKLSKVFVLLQFALGALLTVGLFTQAVALALFVLTAFAAFAHESHGFRKESRNFYIFLALVSLVFVLFGAGSFAFDYPL